SRPCPIAAMDHAALDLHLGVHLRGTAGTTRAAFPVMAAQGGGRVVNTISGHAFEPKAPHSAAYAAAKGAIFSFTLAAARAGAGRGIGRATALLLAEAGARVGCMEIDEGRRAAIVKEVEAAGAEAVGLGGDLRQRADVEAAVASTVEAFGGIDVAIDIAGEAGGTRCSSRPTPTGSRASPSSFVTSSSCSRPPARAWWRSAAERWWRWRR